MQSEKIEENEELLYLRRRVDDLMEQLGMVTKESTLSIETLEKRWTEQQAFNSSIVKAIQKSGNAPTVSEADDSMESTTTEVFERLEEAEIFERNSHKKAQQSDQHSAERIGKKSFSVNGETTTICAFTQTNLAIDPETDIKLSFISPGISSSSLTDHSSRKRTILSTPSSSAFRMSHNSGPQELRSKSHADQISSSSLNKDFTSQDADTLGENENREYVSPGPDKYVGRPPTCPSTNTPSKSLNPLKSILRTPTNDKPAGPLRNFSPSLSPIQSVTNSKAEVEGSGGAEKNKGESALGASVFMSPLKYESSDGENSLHSMSMLNVTSNTSMMSAVGSQHERYSHQARKKKSPNRRRHRSPVREQGGSSDYDDRSLGNVDGDNTVANDGSSMFQTPPRGSRLSRVSTTGDRRHKLNGSNYSRLHHHSESKRTSSFWRQRLDKRKLTSILSSPLTQKLFN